MRLNIDGCTSLRNLTPVLAILLKGKILRITSLVPNPFNPPINKIALYDIIATQNTGNSG